MPRSSVVRSLSVLSSVVSSVLSCVLFFRPALADAPPRFDVARLSVDGNVLAVEPADLDGDGNIDLLAVYTHGAEAEPPRWVGVFWNHGGAFSRKPDVTFRVDDKACAFDVAHLDQAGAAFLTIDRDGVWATRWVQRQPTAPTRLVDEATVFYRPDPTGLPRVPLLHQVVGNARQLVVPLLGAVGIYERKGGTWARTARLPLDEKGSLALDDHVTRDHSSLPSFATTLRYPAVHFADSDGDGRPDVIITLEDRVTIFAQRPGGTFDRAPSYQRNFAVRTSTEAQRVVQGATTTVADFDGDGIADLVIGKTAGRGLTAATSTHYLYLGKRGGGYGDTPDQILRVDGLGGADSFTPLDLTGDGTPDLVVPTVQMGVFAIIRMLTTKTVAVKLQVFPFAAQPRRFLETPITRELKFKISLSGDADFPAVEMQGDYNGDRRPDLAFGISDGEIGIFTGVGANGILSKDPVERIKVESRGRLRAVDLDRRGKDDIVLCYPSTVGHKQEIVVLRNRGNW